MFIHFSGRNFRTFQGGLAKHTPGAHTSYKPIASVFEAIAKEQKLLLKLPDLGPLTVTRVPHGYTAGTIFPHCTRTRVHRDPWRVAPVPNRNSRGVKRVPALFLFY